MWHAAEEERSPSHAAVAPLHAAPLLSVQNSLCMLPLHVDPACRLLDFRKNSCIRKRDGCRCGQGQDGAALPVHIFQCQVS